MPCIDVHITDIYYALMPELPEVETVCLAMKNTLPGKRITSISTSGKRLRAPIDEIRLNKLINDKFIEKDERLGGKKYYDFGAKPKQDDGDPDKEGDKQEDDQ